MPVTIHWAEVPGTSTQGPWGSNFVFQVPVGFLFQSPFLNSFSLYLRLIMSLLSSASLFSLRSDLLSGFRPLCHRGLCKFGQWHLLLGHPCSMCSTDLLFLGSQSKKSYNSSQEVERPWWSTPLVRGEHTNWREIRANWLTFEKRVTLLEVRRRRLTSLKIWKGWFGRTSLVIPKCELCSPTGQWLQKLCSKLRFLVSNMKDKIPNEVFLSHFHLKKWCIYDVNAAN